jgi:hypothetical protein
VRLGEYAAITPARRSATATALDPTETMTLDHDQFTTLRAEWPTVDRFLLEAAITEVRRLSVALRDALYPSVRFVEVIEREGDRFVAGECSAAVYASLKFAAPRTAPLGGLRNHDRARLTPRPPRRPPLVPSRSPPRMPLAPHDDGPVTGVR